MDRAFSLERRTWSNARRAHAHRARIKVVSNLLGRILPALLLHFPLQTSRLHPSRASSPGPDFCPFAHSHGEDPALAASGGPVAVFPLALRSACVYPTSLAPFSLRKRHDCDWCVRHCGSVRSRKSFAGLFRQTRPTKRPPSPPRRGMRCTNTPCHHGGVFHCAFLP